MRRDDAISLALSSAYSPSTADEVWRKHLLLCPHDDERCSHVEEVVEALVAEIEGFDEKLTEARKDEREDVEKEKDEAHVEKVQELEERIHELENELEKAQKTVVPISEGRREAEVWLLGRLREAMNGAAKDLRKEVHGLVVELIKRVNE